MADATPRAAKGPGPDDGTAGSSREPGRTDAKGASNNPDGGLLPNPQRGPLSRPPVSWIPAPSKSSSRGLTSLGQVLVRTHEAMHKRSGALLTAEQWKQIVGERIAARTRVQSVFKGNLLVNAASSAWVAELSFLSADIVARLRAKGHEITALRFRVEPLLEPSAKRTSRRPPKVNEDESGRPSALPEELVARLAQIEDPQLRGAIAEAAMKSLLGAALVAPAGLKPPLRSSFPPAPPRKKADKNGA